MPRARSHASAATCHTHRLIDFAEPRPDDTCLDAASGVSELASTIGPSVGELTTVNFEEIPDGPFTLVTACLAPVPAADPLDLLRRLLDVCAGRLVIADIVRTRTCDSGRVERLRDPARTATRTPAELVELVRKADGEVRRLDVFAIERPLGTWLAKHGSEHGRRDLAEALIAELDGGPRTGTRPRLIGGELWFTQSWAYVAAEPVRRSRAGSARRPR